MNEKIIPNHVAIIMDGNRRWAKERGLSSQEGHFAGSKILEKTGLHIFKSGVKVLSVFAFSTENFKRSKEEVDYLMNLLINMFNKKFSAFKKHDIKIIISGRRKGLRDDVIKSIDNIQEKTKDNKSGILNICINYGGQEELIDASKKIALEYENKKIDLDSLDKESFAKYLYNDLPPIDLVIRTSGEERISNFMLYQMAYSELYFPEIYFPDFVPLEFDKAIEIFNNRNRRFGG